MKLTTLEIRNTPVTVNVDTFGSFSAEIGAQAVRAQTLDELRAKLMAVSKRAAVKVEIPFDLVRGGTTRRGTITGRHQTTRKLLVRWDKGGTDQLDISGRGWRPPYRYGTEAVCRPLTVAEADGVAKQHAARETADQAYKEILQRAELDVNKLLDAEAQAEKADQGGHHVVQQGRQDSNCPRRAAPRNSSAATGARTAKSMTRCPPAPSAYAAVCRLLTSTPERPAQTTRLDPGP
jgi:hypothetical protein